DLKVANMVRNHNLAKAITEVSWAEFRTMLEYKAEWYGKQVVPVNAKYTSQRCNICGHTEKANRKSQSAFVCIKCGHSNDADVNASKNIEELALVV
ncbi:MAG: RNA-guided endonuclease InsQ/TnpB family protein, partial [Bacillus sp. (in: firmicutes)]